METILSQCCFENILMIENTRVIKWKLVPLVMRQYPRAMLQFEFTYLKLKAIRRDFNFISAFFFFFPVPCQVNNSFSPNFKSIYETRYIISSLR